MRVILLHLKKVQDLNLQKNKNLQEMNILLLINFGQEIYIIQLKKKAGIICKSDKESHSI